MKPSLAASGIRVEWLMGFERTTVCMAMGNGNIHPV